MLVLGSFCLLLMSRAGEVGKLIIQSTDWITIGQWTAIGGMAARLVAKRLELTLRLTGLKLTPEVEQTCDERGERHNVSGGMQSPAGALISPYAVPVSLRKMTNFCPTTTLFNQPHPSRFFTSPPFWP